MTKKSRIEEDKEYGRGEECQEEEEEKRQMMIEMLAIFVQSG